jgi:hypothetical protein
VSSLFSLSRITVRHRLYVGFTVVLVMLIAVASVGGMGFRSAEDGFQSYQGDAEFVIHALEIERAVADLCRNALVFTERGDEKAIERVAEARLLIEKTIARAFADSADPAVASSGETIKSLIARYVDFFDQAKRGRQTRDTLIHERLNPIGAALRKGLSEGVAGSLDRGDYEAAARLGMAQENFLDARLNVNKFRIENDEFLVEEAESSLERVVDAIDSTEAVIADPTHKAQVQALKERVPEYRDAFLQVVDAAAEADRLTHVIMPPHRRGVDAHRE